MGKEVSPRRLAFVSFERRNDNFTAFLPMADLLSIEGDPELILEKAAKLYGYLITSMQSLVREIETIRANHKSIPARKIWQLGNVVFELKDELEQMSLQIDGLYDHLGRDLGIKRKWLEKAIIFRRYIPKVDLIPESLNWGRCEKGTRRVAEGLSKVAPE